LLVNEIIVDLLTWMIVYYQLLSLSKLFMANAQSKSLIEDCLFLGGVVDPAGQIWEANGPEIFEETCKETIMVVRQIPEDALL
jgi:hypothetical protein